MLQHKRRHITLVWNDTHCATLEGWFHLGKYISFPYIILGIHRYCIRYLITQHCTPKNNIYQSGADVCKGMEHESQFQNKTRK